MDDTDPRPRRSLVWLGLILAVGLALRLLPVLRDGDLPVLFMLPDSYDYHRLACGLLDGHGYSWDQQPPYTPNLYRLPGFPVLLFALYALSGGPSIIAAIALQALLGAATILLTYFLVRSLNGGPRLALLAAAVQALDPLAIQYGNLLLTEVWSSPLLLLAALCVVRYRATARGCWLLAAGALLAAGILVHPILLFLPFALLAAPLLTRATRSRRQAGFALAALALALAPATAWTVRNWVVGDFLGISCVTAVNMLKYKAAGVAAELRGTTREIERDRLTRKCNAELPPGVTPGDRYRLWQRRGAAIVLAHPLTYAKLHAKGMLVELLAPGRDHTTRLLYGRATLDAEGNCTDAGIVAARTRWPVQSLEVGRHLVLAWQGLLALGMVLGAWQMLRQRGWLLAALLLVPLYVLMVSSGPEADPRFRVLYLPVLSLLTAAGAEALLAWWPARRSSEQPASRSLARPVPVRVLRKPPSKAATAEQAPPARPRTIRP
jgi:4-amino-4-deoxy-L-arabinose transferase-like glycosyltransferase